jgi:hypothetical protein
VTKTVVSSSKFGMVVVREVGRSTVCMWYSNSPRTLPWGTPALIGDGLWCVEAILT